MSTRKFLVSFMLVVPECNGLEVDLEKSVSAKDIEGEIQSWFEDLWCGVSHLQVEEYSTTSLCAHGTKGCPKGIMDHTICWMPVEGGVGTVRRN